VARVELTDAAVIHELLRVLATDARVDQVVALVDATGAAVFHDVARAEVTWVRLLAVPSTSRYAMENFCPVGADRPTVSVPAVPAFGARPV
jgi:hypothetical protein